MKSISRIKFNPVTKEIEVEGSERFVKTYFGKLQAMLSGSRATEKTTGGRQTAGKAATATGRKPAKRSGKSGQVLALIQKSQQGITTADLMKKTGLTDKQIRAIVYRAEKQGKVRKVGRGVYAPA